MWPSLLRRVLSIFAVGGTAGSRALPVICHVGFLSCLCGWSGRPWFSKVVPGFAVLLEAGHAAAAGREDLDRSALAVGFDRNDVPDIVGNDVPDDEIYVAASISVLADIAAGVEAVSVDGAGVGGLDLNAPAAACDIDDEVVAVALAPRLGHAEAERGGFVKKRRFGDFAATLGGEW